MHADQYAHLPERVRKWRELKGEEFIKEVFAYLREELERVEYFCGGYILDYSPRSLERIDQNNAIDVAKEQKRDKRDYSPSGLYAQEGAYLGEVILRTLGGKWRYPPNYRFALSRIFINLGFPFDHSVGIVLRKCGIDLDGRFIPVIRIAKLRLRKSERVKSLHEVYEKIRTTGDWK